MDQHKRKWCSSCSFFRVKNAMQKLQKFFLYLFRWQASDHNSTRSIYDFGTVRKGHFPDIVYSNGEAQQFSVALRYLAYPPFMKLLDAAEQEFGFN